MATAIRTILQLDNDDLLKFLVINCVTKLTLSFIFKHNKPKHVEHVGHVTSLRLHPVKSMKTVQLTSLTCTDTGVKHPEFHVFDR